MSNPYLSMVEADLRNGIENAVETQNALEDFLSDYHFVDGLENTFPNPIVFDSIQLLEKTIAKLREVEKFVKEKNSNE